MIPPLVSADSRRFAMRSRKSARFFSRSGETANDGSMTLLGGGIDMPRAGGTPNSAGGGGSCMLNPSDPAPSSARRRWRASRRARIRCDEKFFSTTSGGSTSAGAGAGVPDGSVSDGTRPAGAGAAEAATPVADAPSADDDCPRGVGAGRAAPNAPAEPPRAEFSCLRGISGAAAKETGMPLPSRAAPCIAEMRWRSTPSSGWSGPYAASSTEPASSSVSVAASIFPCFSYAAPSFCKWAARSGLASPDTSFSTEYAYMVARSAISAGPGSRVGAERGCLLIQRDCLLLHALSRVEIGERRDRSHRLGRPRAPRSIEHLDR